MKLNYTWLPKLILGLSLYVLGTSASFAQLTVNCPGESIQAAIDSAPAGPVSITINGVCTENVLIERDRVTLQSGSGGGVTGLIPGVPSIEIRGASGAIIDGLTVSGGAYIGIYAAHNAAITVQNSTIENNADDGIWVDQGAEAFLDNNSIRFSGECEILVTDSGQVTMQNSTLVSNLPVQSGCQSAIGAFRDTRVRLQGGNTVTNTNSNGVALDLAHGSTFRQFAGHDKIVGAVAIENLTTAMFRDVDITGDMFLTQNSNLRIRDLGSVPNNVTFTGTLNINESNVVQFVDEAPATINATINCNGGTLFGSPILSLGSNINCPAPLHVLRSNGTAQVLVEEINGTASPRNMFELRNNGPVGFNMLNTGTNQRWRFAAQVDGFRINIADAEDAGPEMTVFANGAVQMGKNQAQRFFLDANGNMAVQGTATALAHLTLSDVNAKEDFVELDGSEVLAKLTALPVTEWRFKGDPVRHIGPTAQDFKATFNLGADDTHIAILDVASVALVGVKELNQTLRQEIKVREARIRILEARLAELEAALARVLAAERPAHLAVADTTRQH